MINIEECIEYIKEKHKDQKRMQGTPYYEHPLAVYNILKEKGFNEDIQIVALLHDVIEDTDTSYDEILKLTNKEIADAVLLLTKTKGYIMQEYICKISKNEYAKIVKLADRVHNLSETSYASLEFQKRYYNESILWYLPLAKNTIFEAEIITLLNKLNSYINEQ